MIISTDAELRQYIPNVLATVEGESTLFGKIQQHITAAEEWVKNTFTGDAIYTTIEAMTASERLRVIVANIVASHAFMNAVPSLDLVLTPNGFGIVSNSNVVPASSDRVERLITQLESTRDLYIGFLLRRLPAVNGWSDTEQCAFFQATLFPTLSICDKCDIRLQKWTKYQEAREKLLVIEGKLESQYFSKEQMDVFREVVMEHQAVDAKVQTVIMRIQSLELMLVRGLDVHPQAFFDIVNVIRGDESAFPEWAASATAELFELDSFENEKKSGGYWF